jgi:hypothetical protein
MVRLFVMAIVIHYGCETQGVAYAYYRFGKIGPVTPVLSC